MEKKELVYCCCQPNDLYYLWQVNIWLESCRKYNILGKDRVHILIYKADSHKQWHPGWEFLEGLYPEAEFFRYDDNGIKGLLPNYIPLLRPHTLYQHFSKYPELKNKAIFYHDCDIMLNQALDVDKYLYDDINYVSDTVSASDYMSHKYFESKRKDVLPEMLEEYDKRDILDETAKIVGLPKQTIVDNYKNTGGAQYLLKNIDAKYWDYVQSHSLEIVLFLRSVNKKFFLSENKGFQSWCADMWAVLWGLWAVGKETRVVPELDFCWATDLKEKQSSHPIFHNAGVTSEGVIRTREDDGKGGRIEVEAPAFYKGKYHAGLSTPFRDREYLNSILTNPISSRYCFHSYIEEIVRTQNKYLLEY